MTINRITLFQLIVAIIAIVRQHKRYADEFCWQRFIGIMHDL
jgi:hypothetical protein